MVTLTAYTLMFVADKLGDAFENDDEDDIDPEEPSNIATLMRQLIKALGLLVGFAFERCFDKALVGVAEKWSEIKTDNDILDVIFAIPRPVMEFLLAILVSAI